MQIGSNFIAQQSTAESRFKIYLSNSFMNKEWSELNKSMQTCLRKEDKFIQGINTLFELRNELMTTLTSLYRELSRDDFNAMPFLNSTGYHNKTIAYSIWHIFRIEDIVSHTLINNDEQIFFKGDYQKRINSPIATTGNELIKQHIADFSERLDLTELYAYAHEVKASSEKILKSLTYKDLKTKVSSECKHNLSSLNVVNPDPNAHWLIDYWCSKDIRGLIQMPFSRHWIMHIEANLRIANKLRPTQ